uniref:Uncharacterized protein n=1 Tax=Rhizophora mucronata TaxID=61149 RepID=A0A2P2LTP7_RHIMU
MNWIKSDSGSSSFDDSTCFFTSSIMKLASLRLPIAKYLA